MAHHHQLQAYSQLTNVVPTVTGQGQLDCLQLPQSMLTSAGLAYHVSPGISSPNRTYINLQRPILNSLTIGGGCLICSGSLPPRITRHSGKKPGELFTKVCELLHVPLLEMQCDWDFTRGDKLPFCATCSETLESLVILHEQLEIIQKKLAEGVENVRDKIRIANSRYTSTELRVANFRSRAIGEVLGTPCSSVSATPLSIVQKSSLQHETMDCDGTGTIVSDFNSIFNQTMTGFQHPVSSIIIQQEMPSRQLHQQYLTTSSPQHTIFTSVQSAVTPTPSQSTHTFHNIHPIFTTQVESGDSNVLNALVTTEEYNNDDPKYQNFLDDVDNDFSANIERNSDTDQCDLVPKMKFAKPKKSKSKSQKRVKKPPSTTSNTKFTQVKPRINCRQNTEHFSPVITDESGNKIFEGVTITPGKVGYVCGLCGADCGKGQTPTAMRKVKIHIKGFHLGAYKCTTCNKNFTSNDILSQHNVRTHEQDAVACDICLRPVKLRYLNHHKFTHMNAEEKEAYIATGFKPQSSFTQKNKFECDTCGKTFKKKSVLRRHEASHKDAALRRSHKCKHCDRAYTSEQALKEHSIVHHADGQARKALCKICNKVMYPKYLTKHMKTHIAKEERPFICKICGRRLVNLKTLQRHESLHGTNDTADKYKFECDICGQRFTIFKRMRSHRRKIHPNHWKLAVPSKLINEVTVDKPGDTFIDDLNNEGLQEVAGGKGMYTFHLYEVKKLAKSQGYMCCTCSKKFVGDDDDKIEDEVKSHIRSEHIGNFRCNLCTKRMKNINEVIDHKLADHSEHGESHKCDTCGRAGLTAHSMKRHVWSHKGLLDIADAINAGEKAPIRFEQGLKQRQEFLMQYGLTFIFPCTACKIVFDMLEDLVKHRLVDHVDDFITKQKKSRNNLLSRSRTKRNMCNYKKCGKVFDTETKLKGHKSRVHNEKGGTVKQSKRSQKRKVYQNDDDEDSEAESEISIKEEKVSDCTSDSESDGTEEESSFESDDQSDPEFKTTQKLNPVKRSEVTLRNRGSLRQRRIICYTEAGADEASVKEIQCQSIHPIPVNIDSVKVEDESFSDYLTPDEDQQLLSESEIKSSPHTSDGEVI